MRLVRFRHKGLKRLHEDGNAKGVPAAWLIFSHDEQADTASDIDLIDYH